MAWPISSCRLKSAKRCGEAHPAQLDAARYPALTAHAARCEALPVFAEIVQPLKSPSGE
jgi:hypothetical protein